MANAPGVQQSRPEGKGAGKGGPAENKGYSQAHGKDARQKRNNKMDQRTDRGPNGRGDRGARSSIRRPVLAMCKAPDRRQAEESAQQLKAALLEAESGEEHVDGGLLGMAAAHAGRLGLKDVVECLCAYAWSRLSDCQGREVAEMASAASRCGCQASRFFQFVIVYCGSTPDNFSSLRDISLIAAALVTQSASTPLDLAVAFEGLSKAAKKHLSGAVKPCVRDISEFFYALAASLGSQPFHGGPLLSNSWIVADVVTAIAQQLRPLLHKASSQDIAKATGGAAAAWTHMPHLQAQVLTSLMQDLSTAVRFRSSDFNLQDLSQILVAFAKVDVVEGLSLCVLEEQICANISAFKPKELSLTLWAMARPKVESTCSRVAVDEIMKRDLTSFSAQDLCMSAQALVKIGVSANPALCLVAGEVFARQVNGFSVMDKMLLLWVLAKSKVVHLALARLLVKDLAVDCKGIARDRISLGLWSLAVLWPNLRTSEPWPRLLASALLASSPWQSAPGHEITNAAWAFRQLPQDVVYGSWESLVQSVMWLHPPSLSSHELCNLLTGLMACPLDSPQVTCALQSAGAEIVQRPNVSAHDKALLSSSLADKSARKRLKALGLQSLLDLCKMRQLFAEEARQEVEEVARSHEAESAESEEAEEDKGGEPAEKEHHVEEYCEERPPTPPQPSEDRDRWAQKYGSASSCSQTCCAAGCVAVAIPGDVDAWPSELKDLRLNSHCDFHGHCLQHKNTFIHVDCSAGSDSEDDCMLCDMTRRPRARSMDLPTRNKIKGLPLEARSQKEEDRVLDEDGAADEPEPPPVVLQSLIALDRDVGLGKCA